MSDASEKELKPCPFCGGEAELQKTGVYWVACSKCQSEHGFASTRKAKAITAWNHRPAPPSDSEGKMREAIKAAIAWADKHSAEEWHSGMDEAVEEVLKQLAEQPSQGKETGR